MPETAQTPLHAAGAIIDRLLLPASLAQLAVVAGAALLGWWLARLVRPRLVGSAAPEDLQGRLKEACCTPRERRRRSPTPRCSSSPCCC
jgi:hypothetical protein